MFDLGHFLFFLKKVVLFWRGINKERPDQIGDWTPFFFFCLSGIIRPYESRGKSILRNLWKSLYEIRNLVRLIQKPFWRIKNLVSLMCDLPLDMNSKLTKMVTNLNLDKILNVNYGFTLFFLYMILQVMWHQCQCSFEFWHLLTRKLDD